MWKLFAGCLFAGLLSLAIVACGNRTTTEGGGEGTEGAATAAETPPPTPPPPPAKVPIPCVEDNNKAVGGDGEVTRCKLAADAVIDGFPCRGGRMAQFHPGGKLKNCYMTENRDVGGFTCKSGLSLYKSGNFRRCKLEADRTVNGVALKATDWVTAFEDGSLKRVELFGGPRDLKGFPCKGYMNFFHKNGQLGKCQLNEDKQVGEAQNKAGDFVCWDESGAVVGCSTLRFDMTG